MKNKYRCNDMQEVWNSFEWLYREKLQSLDNMTRQMIGEMQKTGLNLTQIRRFVPKAFADLYNQVAQENRDKNKEGKRDGNSQVEE
ncbi:hypothetical protein [Cohnella abietis]|uniref:Uncharacterized protein n=1 Tax=Cohnella abietis TaxID=2507935 RepID=A0A3T1D1M9_9BACL|nr:hypothetical protein [Cohnella abietis]BBI32017.1 hypothetical protein KCTCHS21_14160 [Cohnella abietis]